MDRLEAMSIFVAAVEAGSLSGAGRALGIPLATVSRKIADLETHLGAILLKRTTRRLSLTEAGRAYLPACKSILGEVETAERIAAGEYLTPRGELSITAPIVFGRLHVLPVIAAFMEAYPEVAVRLTQSDRYIDLLEQRIDIGIRIGELPDSGLLAVRVGTTHIVTCASPIYLAQGKALRVPADLVNHSCISFTGLTPLDRWTFFEAGKPIVAPIRPRLTVTTAEAAIDATVVGLGVTRVLSYQVAHFIAEGKLTPVLAAYAPPTMPVQLIRTGDPSPPLKVRAFIEFAAPRLRERLASITKT